MPTLQGRNASTRANIQDAMFAPSAVAIIGASERLGSLGEVVTRSLLSGPFSGRVIPVNPNRASVLGQPAVSGVSVLKGSVDLAFVCVPALSVAATVRECADAEVPMVVVLAASVAEDDLATEALVEYARERGTRIIGPNCMGIYSARSGLTWTPRADFNREGVAALVSHSGGLAQDLLLTAPSLGFSFAHVASIGNCIDLDEVDILQLYGEDPAVTTIGMYVEGSRRARALLETVDTLTSAGRAVICLKGGRDAVAADAVVSHTGRIAGDYRKWRSLLRSAGAVLVDTPEDLAGCLALGSGARHAPGSCAFVGNGGGAAVLIADWAGDDGVRLATLGPKEIEDLVAATQTPAIASGAIWDVPLNRMTGDGSTHLQHLMQGLAESSAVDNVIFHLNLTAFLNQADADEHVTSLLKIVMAASRSKLGAFVFRTDGSLEAARLAALARDVVREAGGAVTFPALRPAVRCISVMASAAAVAAKR